MAFSVASLPAKGRRGIKGKRLGKTQIGELFFKERVLRLPSPWPDRFKITITERHLRLLITSLIVLFLLLLGTSLLMQLADSRATHVAEQNRLSTLHGQLAAQHVKTDFIAARREGLTPPGIDSSYLAAILPADALAEQRVFAVALSLGQITASVPASEGLDGQSITSVLAPSFVTEATINSGEMAPLQLASGEDAFVAMYDLGDFPGSLIVFQRKADVLSAWRAGVMQVTILFVVALFVLVLLGGAFYWTRSSGLPPRGSTRRWTAASAACGTGTSRRASSSGPAPCSTFLACR